LLLSMVTPNKWCETDPTLKDMVAALKQGKALDEHAPAPDLSYGLIGYPVLQSSDILSVGGSLVPVGKDQLAHLEISRDIARRFNHMTGREVFAEPRPLLTETPSIIGLDGRKMSKSYGNAIDLSMTADQTVKAIKSAVTDAKRVTREDPGEPSDCVAVYPWYDLFADEATKATVAEECRTAARGCGDCKKQLAEAVNEYLAPLRERRRVYAQDIGQVEAILKTGNERARNTAERKLQKVRKAFNIDIKFA